MTSPRGWTKTVRRWSLFSWILLTAITLGGRWAYVELGWAGYWAWDPVENSVYAMAHVHRFVAQSYRSGKTRAIEKTNNRACDTGLLYVLFRYIYNPLRCYLVCSRFCRIANWTKLSDVSGCTNAFIDPTLRFKRHLQFYLWILKRFGVFQKNLA